jgi:hypothetical protein
MHPKIANSQRRISFALSEDYLASLYSDIESAGVIQYHHLLVIYGPDKQPCLFFGSERSCREVHGLIVARAAIPDKNSRPAEAFGVRQRESLSPLGYAASLQSASQRWRMSNK